MKFINLIFSNRKVYKHNKLYITMETQIKEKLKMYLELKLPTVSEENPYQRQDRLRRIKNAASARRLKLSGYRPPIPSEEWRLEYNAKAKDTAKEKRQIAIELGICLKCGLDIFDSKYSTCAKCRWSSKIKHSNLITVRKMLGLCTQCGKKNNNSNVNLCIKCRHKLRKKNQIETDTSSLFPKN